MCLPLALTAAQTMAVTIGMNVVQYQQQEKQREYNREAASAALKVGRMAESSRQTEEMQAAEVERDTIRRKTRLGQGQLQALAATRGTSAASALAQAMQEFSARDGEYQSAITAKRDQQALAGVTRDASRIASWQGRMMQNESQGLGGLALAVGKGYMQAGMLTAQAPDMFGVVKPYTGVMADVAAADALLPDPFDFMPEGYTFS